MEAASSFPLAGCHDVVLFARDGEVTPCEVTFRINGRAVRRRVRVTDAECDSFVEILLDDELVLSTAAVDDVFDATFNDTGDIEVPAASPPASALYARLRQFISTETRSNASGHFSRAVGGTHGERLSSAAVPP